MRCDVYPMMIGAYGDSGPAHSHSLCLTILVWSGASARDTVTCQYAIAQALPEKTGGAQCQPS
jgi:hypothetical protein